MKRAYVVNQADLRMDGDLAMNVKRVLPVTQTDFANAVANGEQWNVMRYHVVNALDNMRGGTTRILKVNAPAPGVQRAFLTSEAAIVTVHGVAPLSLPDAIADSLSYVKAFGGTEQRNLPDGYIERQFIYMMEGSSIRVEDLPISAGYKVEFDFKTLALSSSLRNYLGGRADGVPAGGGFRLSKLASGGTSLNRVVMYGFESGTEYYDPTVQFQANTRYKYTYDDGVCTLESGGSVISTNTFTPTDTTSTDWGINDYFGNSSWSAYHDGMYVYSVKVWNDQGELVMDLVPAVQRGTVPVVGFYDAATGEFRGPTGGTFAAGPEIAPTPDAPMDIVSNNGVLKVKDADLPIGYKRLQDIIFDGDEYYVSSIYLTGADTVRVTFNPSASGYNVLGCYMGSSDGPNFSCYYVSLTQGSYIRYNDTLYRAKSTTLNVDYNVTIGPTGTTGFESDATWTEQTFTCAYPMYIGWLANATSGKFKGTIKGAIVVDGRANFIPCERQSDGAIGYYETYNGVFLENQGTGTPTTSGYDTSMTQVYTDGTVETIKDSLNNTATAEILLKVGDYQDVQSILDGAITRNVGVMVLDGTENWVLTGSGAAARCHITEDIGLPNTGDLTSPMMCSHYSFGGYFSSGSSTTVGTFNAFVRREPGNEAYYLRFSVVDMGISSATDFKNWLVAQYAAGTPVIVVYPLATPTTESVAGQTLQVQAGDNTLAITQASLTGLELEAKYKAAVTLTIQEVQDANLDPNVEVTIQ